MRWIVVNSLFLVAIYVGYFEGVVGAKNLALFFAWVTIVFSFFMLSDASVDVMKKKGRSVPARISVSFELLVTCLFVWFGAWITAPFYLLHIFLTEEAWRKAESGV